MYNSESFSVEAEIDGRYRKLHAKAGWNRWLGKVAKRQRALRSLSETMRGYRILGQHYEGIKTIPLSHIVGSEGRSEDFDGKFRPLKNHTQHRWYSVARARLTDVPLPPVVLIRIGDEYYVRDGNHRVSVGRAFGQLDIEAEVTAFDLAPQAVREVQDAAAGAMVGLA